MSVNFYVFYINWNMLWYMTTSKMYWAKCWISYTNSSFWNSQAYQCFFTNFKNRMSILIKFIKSLFKTVQQISNISIHFTQVMEVTDDWLASINHISDTWLTKFPNMTKIWQLRQIKVKLFALLISEILKEQNNI